MSISRRKFSSLVPLAAVSIFSVPTLGCNTSWIATAQKDIPAIVSVVSSISAIIVDASGNQLIGTAASALLTTGVSSVNAALTALENILATYSSSVTPTASTLSKIEAAVSAVQSQLTALLSSIPVTIPASVLTSINTGISIAQSVIATILLLIPTTKMAVANMKSSAPVTAKLPQPEDIKNQFNAVIAVNGYAQYVAK